MREASTVWAAGWDEWEGFQALRSQGPQSCNISQKNNLKSPLEPVP